MTELSISTAAGVFDAITAGPPEGRPVLLLHGFPQTSLAWRRQIAALNWYRSGRPEHAIGVIDVPTLYVWSTQDTAFGPAAARETRQWVDGPYRFETLQGVSHWIPEEAPETLNRLLLEHLRAHPGPGTTPNTRRSL